MSRPVKLTTGQRQGDALYPIPSNIVLEKVIREINVDGGIVLGNSSINLIAYADDIAILGNTDEEVKRLCGKLLTMSEKVGLYVHDKKTTEYLMISRQDKGYQQEQIMNIEGHIFTRFTHFKYLGHLLTKTTT